MLFAEFTWALLVIPYFLNFQLILFDFFEEHRRRLTFEIEFDDEMDELFFQAGYWDLSSNESDLSDSELT